MVPMIQVLLFIPAILCLHLHTEHRQGSDHNASVIPILHNLHTIAENYATQNESFPFLKDDDKLYEELSGYCYASSEN